MEELQTQLESLLAEVVAYNDTPKKAVSKRIRLKLGSLKNDTASIRAKLVEADKAGY